MADTKRLVEGGGHGVWEVQLRIVFRTAVGAEGPDAEPEFVLDQILHQVEQHEKVAVVDRAGIWELPDEDA